MHHFNQLEGLVEERIRSRLGYAEEVQRAHRAQVDSRAAQTTQGKAGLKKLRLPVPRLSATRSAYVAPGSRLHRRAS